MEQAVGTSPSSIRKEREAKAELRFRTNDMKQENAVYRNSASSENNPLIDALPAPLGRDDLLATLAVENILPDNYQSLSPQARQELCSRLKEIYFPMDYTAEIYMAFYTGLLTAYMGRTKAVATKQLVELGKAIKYNQFAIVPDSPIQAECFAVVGEPGMGKTTTIKKILQLFPPVIYHSVYKGVAFHQIQIPYLFIQCPMNSSIKAVCYQILESIDRTAGTNLAQDIIVAKLNLDVIVTYIAQQCLRFCVGAIVIDEVQNVLRTNTKEPNAGNMMIRFLVGLANKTGACLVCVGTSALAHFFNSEPHLARRTRGPRIPHLNEGPSFRWILKKMWDNIPLLEPAVLTPEIEKIVYQCTGGCIGKITTLLQYAALEAIFFSKETITPQLLLSVAKKHDIYAARATFEAANIQTLEEDIESASAQGKKYTHGSFIFSQKNMGRPKTQRDKADLIVLYTQCKELGLNITQKLREADLYFEKGETI